MLNHSRSPATVEVFRQYKNGREASCVKMNKTSTEKNQIKQIVHIPANGIKLEGALVIPSDAQGIVLFAHGSGSSRHSPRNNFVAQVLQSAGMATLLMDLLTPREDASYETRFDIDFLTRRLERATQWLREQPQSNTQDRLFWRQYRRGCGVAGCGDLRCIYWCRGLTRWSSRLGDVSVGARPIPNFAHHRRSR